MYIRSISNTYAYCIVIAAHVCVEFAITTHCCFNILILYIVCNRKGIGSASTITVATMLNEEEGKYTIAMYLCICAS